MTLQALRRASDLVSLIRRRVITRRHASKSRVFQWSDCHYQAGHRGLTFRLLNKLLYNFLLLDPERVGCHARATENTARMMTVRLSPRLHAGIISADRDRAVLSAALVASRAAGRHDFYGTWRGR